MSDFKRGAKFKHQNNIIISELNAAGYTIENLYRLLKCSKGKSYELLLKPDTMKLSQVKAVCYGINKPLGYVLNKLFLVPDKSPNWLSDEYNPVEHISKLKAQ